MKKQTLVEKTGAVLYLRVSSEDQRDNTSLSTQLQRCEEYCARYGYAVLDRFSEVRSAKDDNRPIFQQMLTYCSSNRSSVGFVVVYQISRFSRDNPIHHRYRGLLATLGIRLRSTLETIDETPEGEYFEGMAALHAQLENKQKGRRTKEAMQARAMKGQPVHRPPIGFTKATVRGSIWEHDPARAPLIALAFELIDQGKSKAETLFIVNQSGLTSVKTGQPLVPQTLENVLVNPAYKGRVCIPSWGMDQEGNFPPLVSTCLFDRVQRILNPVRETVSRTQNPEFPLTVFLRCAGCGKGVSGSFATGKGGKRYPGYSCRTRECRVFKMRRERAHLAVMELIERFKPSEKAFNALASVLEDVWSSRKSQRAELATTSKRREEELKSRKQKIFDAFIDGKLQQAVYDEQSAKVEHDLSQLRSFEDEFDSDALDLAMLLEFSKWMLTNAGSLWCSASSENKRKLQGVFFPTGVVGSQDGIGTPELPFIFKCIEAAEKANLGLASPEGFEPSLPP